MTILKCSAMTCVYNKEQLCSKGDIDVTGENATSANETSCGSFRERTGSSMKDRPPAAGQRYRRLLRPAAPESPAKPGGMRRAGDAKGDDPPWFPYGD
jgi:Domain of Unknown Function (DUF1540).